MKRINNFLIVLLLATYSCKTDVKNNKTTEIKKETETELQAEPKPENNNIINYQNSEIAYVKNDKLYFYYTKDKIIKEFKEELEPVFNCTFNTKDNNLYYTVVRNDSLWLKQAIFTEKSVEITSLINLNLNKSKCLSETYNQKSDLLYYQDNIYLIYDFSWDFYGFTGIKRYSLSNKKIEKPKDKDYEIKNLIFQLKNEHPALSTKNKQLVYKHKNVSTILSDKIDIKIANIDELGLDFAYYQFKFSDDKSKLLFGAIEGFNDLPHGPFCVADTDGKNQNILITDGLSSEYKPIWLGNQLVYIREKNDNEKSITQLCITNPEDNTPLVIDENIDYFTVKKLKVNAQEETISATKEKLELDAKNIETEFYNNSEYTVKGKEREDGLGYDFNVYAKKINKEYHFNIDNIENTIQLFYAGVVNNYLIIDEGSSNIRNLIIINMADGKIVTQDIVYVGEYNFKNNKIYYWREIDSPPKSVNIPPCDKINDAANEQYKYVEKCAFNFETLTIEQLNDYKCQYFE